jgi:hypothetical protein
MHTVVTDRPATASIVALGLWIVQVLLAALVGYGLAGGPPMMCAVAIEGVAWLACKLFEPGVTCKRVEDLS